MRRVEAIELPVFQSAGVIPDKRCRWVTRDALFARVTDRSVMRYAITSSLPNINVVENRFFEVLPSVNMLAIHWSGHKD